MQSNSSYKIFLDDERLPQQCLTFMSDMEYNDDWIVVRSYVEFVNIIRHLFAITGNLPEVISFDHDLGFTHEGDEQIEKTGYDCAKFMTEFCMNEKMPFPRYKVHSRNLVGRENIIGAIEFYNKHFSKNGFQNTK